MKLRAAIVLPAVIAAGAIASLTLMPLTPQRALPSALLQQPTPTPTREPLSGEKIPVFFNFRIPYGIISEETESYISESIPAGNPSSIRYHNSYYNRLYADTILTSQEILLPADTHIEENPTYPRVFRRHMEWPRGYPLGFPSEMTRTDFIAMQIEIYRYGRYAPRYGHGQPGRGYPPGITKDEKFLFDIFAFGSSYYITYKNERVLIASDHGYFLVGEEQVDLFWFLFEQLGENKALIIDAGAYNEWWTDSKEREFWVNRFTPPPPSVTPATPSTLPPLPPGTPALSTKQR